MAAPGKKIRAFTAGLSPHLPQVPPAPFWQSIAFLRAPALSALAICTGPRCLYLRALHLPAGIRRNYSPPALYPSQFISCARGACIYLDIYLDRGRDSRLPCASMGGVCRMQEEPARGWRALTLKNPKSPPSSAIQPSFPLQLAAEPHPKSTRALRKG